MSAVLISTKGQIVLPVAVRKALGLTPGMRVNVKSIVLMTRFAAPAMGHSGGGSIINIGSSTGLHGGHPNLLYPTAKGAIINLTRTLAGQSDGGTAFA